MKIEIRANGAVIEGYVNAVGRDSRMLPSPLGRFVEQVTPKTFERALSKGTDVQLRLNHERTLGSLKNGDLELREDNIGLFARAWVTDPEVLEKARRDELRGWSFGFFSDRDHFEELPDGLKRRYLDEIELREVSIIDNRKTPAYIGTSIEARGETDAAFETRGGDDPAELVDSTPKPDYARFEQEIANLRKRGNAT